MPNSPDAYVSFRGGRRRDFGVIAGPRPLIFADLDSENVDLLRNLPAALLAQREGFLLIRSAGPGALSSSFEDALTELLKRWTVRLRVGLLSLPVGKEPSIRVVQGELTDGDSDRYLARARALELEALLDFGKAIWRPQHFHYRLVTGEHAASYIKLGDALREPRDATVLASWLHERLSANVGIVVDTGTLTPLAQALELAASRSDLGLGPVLVLDRDPQTGIDVHSAVDRAADPHGRVLLIVSVSSSGHLVEQIRNVLQQKMPSLVEVHVAVLAAKREIYSTGPVKIDVWTPLEGQTPLVEPGTASGVACPWCRTPGRAAVVPIDPFSFDAMSPTQLVPIVPDTRDPVANAPLWEAANRTHALAVESPAHLVMRRHRSPKVPMGIVMDPKLLITDDEFVAELRGRIEWLQGEGQMRDDADLVLVAEHESHDAFYSVWNKLDGVLGGTDVRVMVIPRTGEFDADLVGAVRDAKSILLFGLGTVSGASLQHALVEVQRARRGEPAFELRAFVVHARPATVREWQTLSNSFGRDGAVDYLQFGWRTVLPDRSPLREEGALLRKLDPQELENHQRTFVNERLSLCNRRLTGDEADGNTEVSVLWGEPGELTPNSLYGQALDVVTTYVAVGSAMATALAKPTTGIPELRVFEVAALARSYYDPIIVCCFFRWMRPHEIFWGWTGTEAAATALHILDRAEGEHRALIVPELLLAVAQGKLTREAADVFVDAASNLLRNGKFSNVHTALEVGLKLVDAEPDPPPTGGLLTPEGSITAT